MKIDRKEIKQMIWIETESDGIYNMNSRDPITVGNDITENAKKEHLIALSIPHFNRKKNYNK